MLYVWLQHDSSHKKDGQPEGQDNLASISQTPAPQEQQHPVATNQECGSTQPKSSSVQRHDHRAANAHENGLQEDGYSPPVERKASITPP